MVYSNDLGFVEVEVPINIALIKYWGKRDEDLILPINNSVSLNINALVARTRVSCSSSTSDAVKINDVAVDLEKSKRFRRCFDLARHFMQNRQIEEDVNPLLSRYGFEVSSTTNFPVGAGLASSAAGFAAIAVGIGHLCNFSAAEISTLARIGSGSACRSVFGGLVEWFAGNELSGIDCTSKQILPEGFWPELRAVIVVLDETEKEVSSSIGMRRSVETSELMKYRAQAVVPERIERITKALREHDFNEFARVTMADSNQLHAICLDTFPPLRRLLRIIQNLTETLDFVYFPNCGMNCCFDKDDNLSFAQSTSAKTHLEYMTDASWNIVRAVDDFNSRGTYRAAYTFDAGPNACIFVEDHNVSSLLEHLSRHLSLPGNGEAGAGGISSKNTCVASTNFIVRKLVISEVGGSPRLVP